MAPLCAVASPDRQWKDLTDDFAWQLYEVSAARQQASLKLERSLLKTTSPELQVLKETIDLLLMDKILHPFIPLFTRFYTYQAVQDFVHQQYYREFENTLIDLIDSRVLFTCRPM